MYFRTRTRLDVQRLRRWYRSDQAEPALRRVRKSKKPGAEARTVGQDIDDILRMCDQLGEAGILEQQYFRMVDDQGRPHGRAYAMTMGTAMAAVQAMPKEARALLLEGHQVDVDMCNASIAFTADMLLECDNTAMAVGRYDTLYSLADPDQRELFLKRIVVHYGLAALHPGNDREAAKKLLQRITFVTERELPIAIMLWKREFEVAVGTERMEEVNVFARQFYLARAHILTHHPRGREHAQQVNERHRAEKREGDLDPSAYASLMQGMEHEVLMECVSICEGLGFSFGDWQSMDA